MNNSQLTHAEFESLHTPGFGLGAGEALVVADRRGAGKTGEALARASAASDGAVLYFSTDLSSYAAAGRLAGHVLGLTVNAVERVFQSSVGGRKLVLDALRRLEVTFAFGELTEAGIRAELDAYRELHGTYPAVIVLDNVADAEWIRHAGEANRLASELAREYRAGVVALNHA